MLPNDPVDLNDMVLWLRLIDLVLKITASLGARRPTKSKSGA